MEQVPHKIPYGIIGDGRVARHFARYLGQLSIPFHQWSRRGSQTSVENSLNDVETVLLLISDGQIEAFKRAHPFLDGKRCVHFSGSLVSKTIVGAHPLMTFGPEFYPLEKFKKIPFVCEEGRCDFRELFPLFPNPHFELPLELKPRYHALCVMSGNFTTLLWNKFFSEIENMGLPKKIALPYLEATFSNIASQRDDILTGPLARKDGQTLEKNLRSLSGDPYQKIFRSFIETHMPEMRLGGEAQNERA